MKLVSRDLEESSVLGFDCEFEWSHGRRKVAILQLCSHRGRCVIIQLLELQHFSWWLRVSHNKTEIIFYKNRKKSTIYSKSIFFIGHIGKQ